MFRKSLLVFSLLAALFITGCQEDKPTQTQSPVQEAPATATATLAPTATPTPTDTPEPTPTEFVFEPVLDSVGCPFETFLLEREAECFRITLPEDHNEPANGRTITQHVAVFKSGSSSPAEDPIIYLSGGPGEDSLETVDINFNLVFDPLIIDRDLIMFEQRGTGASSPSLDCPELKELTFEYLDDDLESEEVTRLVLESYTQCHDRLSGEGVNFRVYNSAQNAADVAMLRKALGYSEWNLYGVSYGTRLAQTVMRDHPEGIRSVVLDSAYPLEVNLQAETPANLKRAMDVFFAACKADEACNGEYPDLENVFWELVEDFNQEPRLITASNFFTGETYDVLVNGDALLSQLFGSLYSVERTSLFPRLVYQTREGNTDILSRFTSISLLNIDFVSLGMQYAVQCNEEISFSDPEAAAAAASEFVEFEELFTNGGIIGLLGFEICEIWDSGTAAAIENEPVRSDIPTLILAGEHDPITPPDWGRQIADHYGNAYFFEYPGQGHGPGLTSDCARSMMLDFFDMPGESPDDTCIADMGFAFAVSLSADDISLVPFSDELFDISGVVPEGWQEVAPGSYANASGTSAIVQQAAPGAEPEQLAGLLFQQLGLEEDPEPAGTLQAGQFTWTVYQFPLEIEGQGSFEIDLAIAEEGGATYLVLMQTTPDDYEALHEGLFLPALEALAPN